MAVRRPENAPEAHPDAPRPDGLDRYAIYAVNPAALVNQGRPGDEDVENRNRRRVYATSREGIGQGIEMLYDEEEIPRGWRIGILDREKRFWLVNPFV